MPFRFSRALLTAAAVVFGGSLLLYTVVWLVMIQPALLPEVELGFENDYQPAAGVELVKSVQPNSPAEKAGLQTGDRIVAFDSVGIKEGGLRPVWRQHKPGDRIRLTVQRPGVAAPIFLTGVFRRRAPASGTDAFSRQVNAWFPWPFIVVGLAVLLLRLEDPNAWLLALLFGAVATSRGWPPVSPRPAWWPIAMAYQGVLIGMVGPLCYWFYARFPASFMDRRWPWLKWTLGGLGLVFVWGAIRDGRVQLPPPFARWLDESASERIGILFVVACLALGLLSFAVNFRSTRDPEARRKIRMMFWSTVAGLGPSVVKLLIENVTGSQPRGWVDSLLVALLCLVPLGFAYAVVVHRVLEIPVLLKRSARYLLVQRGFTFLLSLASIGLTLLFALSLPRYLRPVVEMNQPFDIALGAVFGTALLWSGMDVHKRVSGRIDRAFFRGAYDARMILEELAEKTRTATGRPELERLLEVHLAEALHPSFLRVELQPGAEEPETQPEYVAPILGRDGSRLGALMLGPRLSEEPYSGEDRRLLAAVASQAAATLENIRLAGEIAERIESERRTAREMEIARDVQSRLLPQAPPRLKTLECAARCVQARAVGGDYYDFLDLGHDRTGLVLADVSGKGVHAALLVAHLQACLRTQSSMAPLDLVAMLCQVNQMLYRSTAAQHFATLFFGIYDDRSRRLLYVNCGHNPPVWLRHDGSVARLEATATVIGAFDRWQGSAGHAQVEAGDLLVVFSDGVTEAPRDEEEFGERRLIDELISCNGSPVNAIVADILDRVQEFSQGTQSDDLTLLVARAR